MKNIILKAHKEEIAPQSLAINSKNHQNLRLLKRFDMSIDIKTQYNNVFKLSIKVVFPSINLHSGAFEEDQYNS